MSGKANDPLPLHSMSVRCAWTHLPLLTALLHHQTSGLSLYTEECTAAKLVSTETL